MTRTSGRQRCTRAQHVIAGRARCRRPAHRYIMVGVQHAGHAHRDRGFRWNAVADPIIRHHPVGIGRSSGIPGHIGRHGCRRYRPSVQTHHRQQYAQEQSESRHDLHPKSNQAPNINSARGAYVFRSLPAAAVVETNAPVGIAVLLDPPPAFSRWAAPSFPSTALLHSICTDSVWSMRPSPLSRRSGWIARNCHNVREILAAFEPTEGDHRPELNRHVLTASARAAYVATRSR